MRLKRAVASCARVGAVLFFCSAMTATVLSQNAPGELFAVKKGVFSMKVGQSLDLMNRGILLHLVRLGGKAGDPVKDVVWTMNGQGGASRIGVRLDLKSNRNTRDFVKDKNLCVLDIVSAVWPIGGEPSATFRLLCD